MSMYIGEALAGDGNEVAHIDLLIGDKTGPVGIAFANALARQSEGHSNLLAVLTPNVLAKPATVMITKVTIKGAKQAVQMFGPAQAAVAKAVTEFKGGRIEYRNDRFGNVHVPLGKASFEPDALVANLAALTAEIMRVKPASSKGRYVKQLVVSSTMGPGVKIDVGQAEDLAGTAH